MQTGNGVFISWRVLGTEPEDTAFNVYRDGQLLNGSPLTGASNYTDNGGSSSARYEVRAVIDGKEIAAAGDTSVWGRQFLTVDLNRPNGGTSPDGSNYSYSPGDASVADLDGDGEYEIILKWDPSNAKDNAHEGHTGNVFVDAYEITGEQLWRIDLGRNIRAGAHYTQFMAYDFDGDGKAEVAMKTADGTRDGAGTLIGSSSADYRNGAGRVLEGPEFLTIFNGESGAAMQTIPYPNARGRVTDWGDGYGNRVDRFLAGVAYLDGKRPSMIFSRGYYEKAMISALDWRDGQLTVRWTFTADGRQNQAYRGQGAHSLSIADVDGDGRQEIIFGAATIDDNGQGLYSTGLCHGDALHATDIDPSRDGIEVFMVHESPSCYGNHGVEVHDGATGQILYSNDGGGVDVGRGVAIDIDPNFPGVEVFGSRGGTMTTTGRRFDYRPGTNFAVWWDGDLLREILDGSTIDKWDYRNNRTTRLLNSGDQGGASINGTKSTPVLSADLMGDWREEVIWRNTNNRQLMIYTTTIPTEHRLTTLMHDPQYRVAIAWQNVAYNQPPHPGFFLGDGMSTPPTPELYEADGDFEEPNTVKIQEDAQGFCGVDGVVEATNTGYSGPGYANTENAAGNAVTWTINVPSAEEYTLGFRYAGTTDRPATLHIDGNSVPGSFNFDATGSWTTWSTQLSTVPLKSGANHIRLEANTADGLANIDYLEVYHEGASAGNCP